MNFKEFMVHDWVEDLLESMSDQDYYMDFNCHLGGPLASDTPLRLVEFAISEAKKEQKVANFSSRQWDHHRDKIKKLFRPKVDKHGRIENPHKGINLVSPGDNNPKTQKGYNGSVTNPHTGEMRPMKNAVMHLLPAGFSGCNTCSGHTAQCAAACLDVAGNPGFMGVKTAGRAKRTFMFAYSKNDAMKKLAKEIEKHQSEAHKFNLNFGMRLNGTSDIPWESERYKFEFDRENPPPESERPTNCPKDKRKKSIFCHFPETQFYDYTKLLPRAMAHAEGNMPPNYHLTFSYSENTKQEDMEKLLDAGGNVAMVFAFAEKNYDPEKAEKAEKSRGKKTPFSPKPKGREDARESGPYKIPKVWRGENGKTYKIISGDTHDLRFIDDMNKDGGDGVIVGLAAKGDAKFVRPIPGKQVFVVQPDDPHLRDEPENQPWMRSATKAMDQRLQNHRKSVDKNEEAANKIIDKANSMPEGEEKRELLDRARRMKDGVISFTGPDAQRKRSNMIYSLAKEPDSLSLPHLPHNPEGLSPLELSRKAFKDKALKDMNSRIEKEIKGAEKMSGSKWSQQQRDEYIASKRLEYADDYHGLSTFKQKEGLPHWTASDKPPENQTFKMNLPTRTIRS